MADSSPDTGAEAGPSAPDIESSDAFERLRTTTDTVLVDFYADWCGPCRLMADIVDELAAESDVPIVKVDVETLPEVTDEYGVHGVPAFVVFRDGEPVDRLVGMQDKAELRRLIE